MVGDTLEQTGQGRGKNETDKFVKINDEIYVKVAGSNADGSLDVVLKTGGEDVAIQNPLPTNGDSVYEKDIDVANSNIGGFSGSITDLVDNLSSTIVDSSVTNPKEISIKLKRPVDSSNINIFTPSGDFSNVLIQFKDSAGNIVETIDDSGTATKRQFFEYSTTPISWNELVIQFHTTDPVTLGFIQIQKTIHTHSILQALKPDGTTIFIDATAGGNLKFSLEEFDGSLKNNPLPVTEKSKTAFGEVLTGQLSPQFQSSFEYTVNNTDLNTITEVNGGTVTQASGMAVLSTSTSTASTALFQSKQHAKYRPGLGGVDRFTILLANAVAGTEQLQGLADEVGSSQPFKNGYMIGSIGTTFGFHRFQNDTVDTIALANWDDPLDGNGASGATIDQTKLNVFFIQYQYLGAGAIKIYFEKQNGELVLVHTVNYAGLNIEPSVHNPNFHHTMWVNNGATTSNMIMKSSSYAYFVEGKTSFIELHQPLNSSGTRQKTAVTSEVAIFTIRNKSTYASKTNFIDIVMLNAFASIEASSANNLGTARLVKNATLGGTPSYSDINTNNSVMEIDTAGTTLTGGTEIIAAPLAGKNDKAVNNLSSLKIILNPGESLTFAGSSANSATINAGGLWKELF